jgi:2-methylcitrate dehydratase
LRKDGWDHVIYGAISQALAVGKLMGLNKEQLAQAVNINLSTNISSRRVREASELSMFKALAFSNVARNAVISCLLAKSGMSGPNEIFEGKYGMMNMLTGKFRFNAKGFGKKKGHFKILDCWLKNWPAEIHSQSVIHGALELRKELDVKEIKKIEVETHEAGYTIIGSGKEKWHPKTRETADHSIPYLDGSALHYGNISKDVFTASAFKNKKVLDIVAKVSVKEDKKLTKLYPKAAPNRIRIH